MVNRRCTPSPGRRCRASHLHLILSLPRVRIGNAAEYARDSVDADDGDGDIQSVGNALIDGPFLVREFGGVRAKHDGVLPF